MFHEVQNPAYGLLRLPAEPIALLFSLPENIPRPLKIFCPLTPGLHDSP